MKYTVDLNVDLAEGFAFDAELLAIVSSANVACGLHAGDAVVMQSALRLAKQHGVRVGAHPSFPDRANFGRTNMNLPPDELRAHLRYQLGAIKALCMAEGIDLSYVKPHGALYNQAAKDSKLAKLIAETVRDFDPKLAIMGQSALLAAGQEAGLVTISEVFADRRYHADGSLVARSHAAAVIENDDEAVTQVLQMVRTGTVPTLEGETIPVNAQSICLHGDNQHALAFARKIQSALVEMF